MVAIKSILWGLAGSGLVRLEPANGSIQVDTKIVMLYTEEDLNLALSAGNS